MYCVKMTFTPFEKMEITDENVEELSWPVWGFLCDLSRSCQAYKHELIHDGGVFTAFFLMPELDSMDEKNCDCSVLDSLSEIRNKYGIVTEILGQDIAPYKLCDCKEPSWYILHTHHGFSMTPIICGDCRGMIPTYKLPDIELSEEYSSVPGWQREYTLMKELWHLGSFDGFTYRQLSSPKSQLSKSGREICSAYEKALGKPFYYFLFYWNESWRARGKKCPVCGEDWTLEEDIWRLNYKCDTCRLVSL